MSNTLTSLAAFQARRLRKPPLAPVGAKPGIEHLRYDAVREIAFDDRACHVCGFHDCQHRRSPVATPLPKSAPSDALPDGWRATHDGLNGFAHRSGAYVYQTPQRRGDARPWWAGYQTGALQPECYFATRAEAMEAAVPSKAAQPEQRPPLMVKPGDVVRLTANARKCGIRPDHGGAVGKELIVASESVDQGDYYSFQAFKSGNSGDVWICCNECCELVRRAAEQPGEKRNPFVVGDVVRMPSGEYLYRVTTVLGGLSVGLTSPRTGDYIGKVDASICQLVYPAGFQPVPREQCNRALVECYRAKDHDGDQVCLMDDGLWFGCRELDSPRGLLMTTAFQTREAAFAAIANRPGLVRS